MALILSAQGWALPGQIFAKLSYVVRPINIASEVLRDVLGYHVAEVADMLASSSEPSVKGALQRARATLDQRLPATDREQAPPPCSPRERELVRRFADAFEADDIDGIIAPSSPKTRA